MNHQGDYLRLLTDWRADRIAKLTAEDGWLNLVGLWWLDDGPVRVGAAADCDAVLPYGPDFAGTVSMTPNGFFFQVADGGRPAARIEVAQKGPSRFPIGEFPAEIAMLAGRPALRIRDRKAAARKDFGGIDCFPADPGWRIVADWVALDAPLNTSVDTVIGQPSEVTISHRARFEHDGQACELLATHGTPQAPQFVIRDLTSGKSTYPACRFLFGEEVGASTIVLDFNKAINPPCAFTPFAICPLPPRENVLPFAVEAGEKTWKG